MKKKIVYVVGTRPEFIRSAFIINQLKHDKNVDFHLVHTGQHYSYSMDKVFFNELGLPDPDTNLETGSGTHAYQTADILKKFEDFLIKFKPDLVAVFGDTNSTLAASLATVKLKIPLAHLEAGCREWEMDMPEEINRIMVDHISRLLLPVSNLASQNLKSEKVRGDIIRIGDPLYEVFKYYSEKIEKQKSVTKPYILLTLHRDKNTNDPKRLKQILSLINDSITCKIIYPCHPRTMDQLKKNKISLSDFNKINFTDPVSYSKIIPLISNSEIIITDSGGLQKEAFWSKKLCITLRENTAWNETVRMGVNFTTGNSLKKIGPLIRKIWENRIKLEKNFRNLKNPYYRKNNITNIVEHLKAYAANN